MLRGSVKNGWMLTLRCSKGVSDDVCGAGWRNHPVPNPSTGARLRGSTGLYQRELSGEYGTDRGLGMRSKRVRLGLIVVLPILLLLVGALFMRAGGDSRADEPVFSVASTWPPIHKNLSQTSDKYSRATDFASNGDDIVAVWSEGFTSNDSYNGLIRMAWNGVSKGEWVEKDVYIEGGFVDREDRNL